MLTIRCVSTLCLFCCVVTGTASAQSRDKKSPLPIVSVPTLQEPEAVAKAQARVLFEKGANAYRDGRFYDAVDIFIETNRLYPDPKLSFNVAKAFEGLGNQSGALRYYREYLRRLPDAPDKKEVDGHVEQLELALSQKGLQQLTVSSTPEGATLTLDGQAVGVTPWTGESFAGKHRVLVEVAGHQQSERVIEVDLHRARDFDFELTPLPKPAPPRLPVLPARPEPKLGVLTLATLTSGLALLGTALIAQAASGSDSRGATRTSAFFAGSGAGLAVLGGVMLYFDLNPSPGSSSSGISWDGPGLSHSR
jgi:tetratricopeptide (TPR) repeat protein